MKPAELSVPVFSPFESGIASKDFGDFVCSAGEYQQGGEYSLSPTLFPNLENINQIIDQKMSQLAPIILKESFQSSYFKNISYVAMGLTQRVTEAFLSVLSKKSLAIFAKFLLNLGLRDQIGRSFIMAIAQELDIRWAHFPILIEARQQGLEYHEGVFINNIYDYESERDIITTITEKNTADLEAILKLQTKEKTFRQNGDVVGEASTALKLIKELNKQGRVKKGAQKLKELKKSFGAHFESWYSYHCKKLNFHNCPEAKLEGIVTHMNSIPNLAESSESNRTFIKRLKQKNELLKEIVDTEVSGKNVYRKDVLNLDIEVEGGLESKINDTEANEAIKSIKERFLVYRAPLENSTSY